MTVLVSPPGVPIPGPSDACGPRPTAALNATPDPQPLWLTGGPWPLFAWMHRPAGTPAGVAVLCPPLLTERDAAYHTYRSLARGLAAAGLLAVRFDYEGTGDSGGPSSGPGRATAWLRGVDRALAVARQAGEGPLALIGLRSGALVAAATAERRRDVDALVLWDPWRSGRAFLRHQRALHSLLFPGAARKGATDVPGAAIDEAGADALRSLDLPGALTVRRALLLVRPGETAPPIPLAVRAPGSAVQTAAEVGRTAPGEQEGLFEVDTLERREPVRTVAEVVGWTCSTLRELGGSTNTATTATNAAAAITGSAGTAAIPPVSPGERTVHEEPVWLGPQRLFGIETRVGSNGGGWPVAVFLSSGRSPHTGPNRLWVELARRWSVLGARCVRVDLSGWGDSDPREGKPAQVLRPPEAFDDVRAVVDALGGPRGVVLVGLCSGAYQALESALELAPLGVLAVNPLLRFTPPEVAGGARISARRRICDLRPAWMADLRSRLPRRATGAAVALRQAFQGISPPRGGESWLDDLGRAGVHVLGICGEAEARQLPSPPAPGGLVSIEVVPGLDHALLESTQRNDVADRLTAELLRIKEGA